MAFLRKLPRYIAGSGVTIVGASSWYNIYHPLNVIWDLDETLVSSAEKFVKDPKPGKEYVIQISRTQRTSCNPDPVEVVEHIDDDGLHFVTTARPHAITVLRLLRLLPGCNQFVSTSASVGYMNNVLELLDPRGDMFKVATAGQSSRGKPVFDTLPAGTDPDLCRTVLVDNRASCHTPQPQNGLVVTDFVHPRCDLILVEDRPAGRELGRFAAASSADHGTKSCGYQRGKVALAERGSARLNQLATDAVDSGAEVIVVYDPTRKSSCFPVRVSEVTIPVVSVGAAAGRAIKANPDAKIAIQRTKDKDIWKMFGTLLLCWIVPNVRWVLPGDASSSSL